MTKSEVGVSSIDGSTEVTRFNAMKHGLLSRYTVLPWEDGEEYQNLVASLSAEHMPDGPTEEHLVEELAGILWRKRRLLDHEQVHRLVENHVAAVYVP